jgi:hypothetical protein
MSDTADAHDDELLLGLVRDAVEAAEPGPPDEVVEAIVAGAFRLRPAAGADGAKLASFVTDSLEVGGVRAAGADRVVTFAAGGTTIEVHFLPGNETVVGQVVPAGVRSATIETPEDTIAVEVDDLGRFICDVTSSFVRVRLGLPDGSELVTRWIVR